MSLGVLFVSPYREDAVLLSRMLGVLSMPLEHVADLQHTRMAVRENAYPVILTEAALADGTWLDVLALAREVAPDSHVIVTNPRADARFWAEVLNMGAYDLIAQPFASAEVQRILSNACSNPIAKLRTAHAAV